MLITKTRKDALILTIKALMPIMHEVYKQSSDLAQAGFKFDDKGHLYNTNDKEWDDIVCATVEAISLAKFREQYGKSVEEMGYRLCADGHVVPKRSAKERFLEIMINPLGDNISLIAYEDSALVACLKKIGDVAIHKGDLQLLESGDKISYLIVAAPWRVSLAGLYVSFIDECTAMEKLKDADPLLIMGMVIMARVFADHLQIRIDYDWFATAMTSAYIYAKLSYSR